MDDEFIFTQTEYAKVLGISRECLRTRRRTGKLEGEYKLINGTYQKRQCRQSPPRHAPEHPEANPIILNIHKVEYG